MNRQAYDQRNQEDFDEYSLALTKALLEIQNNKKLKATVAQLSKMTGIHRNTISGRMWPSQKIEEIKKARKVEAQKQQDRKRRSSIGQKTLLEEDLSRARKEIVYWFNEYQDMKRFYEHSDKHFHQVRDARDFYKNLYEAEKKQLLDSEEEIDRLRDLLELR